MRGIFQCEHDHCFVIYDSSQCPLCEVQISNAEAEKIIGERDASIERLKDELEQAEDVIDTMQEQLE